MATDIPATATVLDYGVELRPAKFGRPQDLIGIYAEDQVALTPALTATLGLRWDYDSVSEAGAASGDENNIAPRLGMNYGITDTVSLRAGAGLFYEKLRMPCSPILSSRTRRLTHSVDSWGT